MLTAGLVALAFVLAAATYWFIERPVRRWRVPAVPLSLFGATATACLVGALVYTGVFSPRLDGFRHHDVGDAVADWRYPEGLTRHRLPSGLQIFTAGDGPKTVLFFGDSNVQQYWPRIEHLQKALRLHDTIAFATKGGCPPIPGIDDKRHPDCIDFADRALALAKGDDVATVVIGASWMTYFHNSAYRLAGAGGGQLLVGSAPWERAFDALAETMRALVADGKNVWLVLNIPNGGALAPAHGLKRSGLGEVTFRPVSLERKQFEGAYAPIRERLIEAARASGAHIIDPVASLCGKDSCPGQTADGAFMYKDGSHLRAGYVRDHASFIDAVVQDATASINP